MVWKAKWKGLPVAVKICEKTELADDFYKEVCSFQRRTESERSIEIDLVLKLVIRLDLLKIVL